MAALVATAAAAEASIVAAVAKRRSSEATRRNQNPAMLKDATIDDLKDSKVLADGLRALVHVRSFKSSKCEIKLPGKGTVDEAKAGTENLFSMVHRLKARPIVIRAPAPPTPVVVPPPVPPTERTIAADGGGGTGGGGGGGGGGGSGKPASDWVANSRWVSLMLKSTTGAVPDAAVTADTAGQADVVARLLEGRLVKHIQSRARDTEHHYVWEWVRDNIARVAAWLAVSGLVNPRVKMMSQTTCMLRADQLIRVNATNGQLEGCYIHVDKVTLEVPRTGKVVRKTGGGALSRNTEHAAKAMLLTAADVDKPIYTGYPQRSALNVVPEKQRGWWDELEQCVGLFFDRSDTAAVKALCDTNASRGLLSWRPIHMQRIRLINFKGAHDKVQDKQLHMVGYLFELIFDLMLAPSINLSQSPGFETPLGVF